MLHGWHAHECNIINEWQADECMLRGWQAHECNIIKHMLLVRPTDSHLLYARGTTIHNAEE